MKSKVLISIYNLINSIQYKLKLSDIAKFLGYGFLNDITFMKMLT